MRNLLTLAIAIFLVGCAASSKKADTSFGNFMANASPTQERLLADDATRQLVLLYPPASTRLEFRQIMTDNFGKHLVELLRGQGYALQEVQPLADTPPITSAALSAASPSDAATSTPFNYVLDAIASPRLYRVTLTLGTQTISRAYVSQNETIHPAGAWVRKE
ncbi:conjugal transfer protein TrbH [Rugamonas rivuli]|uniref:Conjugal transfer protein TrbH n=1 Tax=Rugamonas rivuli TaxID=2743358 RepID=A0A843SHS4_9BURK|nr:conjugal transfer protein TrbH [Rugamonas rivuli]MQA21660.1 conjugal transfer protein TrbH [Rugamonas rivuli]